MNISELVKKNMIVRAYAGSIAYGTNTPDSDVDIRGIFCAEPRNILTPFFPVKESVDVNEEDTKYFELAHFFKLCLDCNPNIIELIHQDDESILFRTEAYDFIRSHRFEFLSQKIAYTTSGYAASQMKRLHGHKKWIMNPQPKEPPQPKQFVSMVQYFGKDKMLKFNIDEWNKDHELIPYGGNVFGIVEATGRNIFDKFGKLNTDWKGEREILPLPKIIVKFNKEVFKEMLDKHTNYWTWKKNRNKKRSELEEKFGFDGKHAMHLIRLLRMGEEALTTGEILVKRPDAEELLAIRNGAWTYEELIEYAEYMDNNIKHNLMKTTDLPKKPDLEKASKILMEAQFMCWGKHLVDDENGLSWYDNKEYYK